jgi:hypothetical protein
MRLLISIVCASLLGNVAHAERIEIPIPQSLVGAPPSEGDKSLLASIIVSVAATAAGGGKLIVFPLIGPRDAPVKFQAFTPGQSPETADESFRIVVHSGSRDELAVTEKLAKDLTTLCPKFPPKLATMPNGATLLERESTDCTVPGYRYTVNRYLKGAEGMYQLVYLARRVRPSDTTLEAWRTRLAEAKVVQ